MFIVQCGIKYDRINNLQYSSEAFEQSMHEGFYFCFIFEFFSLFLQFYLINVKFMDVREPHLKHVLCF
jgi:hypothetical protein